MSDGFNGESDGKAKRDSRDADDAGKGPRAGDKGKRKQKSTDLGRALRTIYDDTLRESVPDDFADLLGKLS